MEHYYVLNSPHTDKQVKIEIFITDIIFELMCQFLDFAH